MYHASADYLAHAIETVAPDLSVIALTTRDELAAALPAIEVLFAPAPPRDGWAAARRLRLIQLLGTGADTLLPSPDLPAHVEIAGMRGELSRDVAEHALALLLSHARGLRELAAQQAAHDWRARPRPSVAGQRLAIIGYGTVGRRLAALARALDIEVTAVSRSGRDRGDGVRVVDGSQLGDAIADARFVVIAAPLTAATRGLLDATLLARLRADAYVINVARGEIVDETALTHALRTGRLAGAALDVVAMEPLPADSPLWDVPNLVITPHVAGLGEGYIDRCIGALLANVAALATGAPRRGLVDREVGY